MTDLAKLFLDFALLVLVCAGLTALGLWLLYSLPREADPITRMQLEAMEACQRLDAAAWVAAQEMQQLADEVANS